MTDLTQTTVSVKGPKGDNFVFKIPSLHDEFRVASRVKAFCRRADPEGGGSSEGLDWWTVVGLQAAATFEVLLEKADVEWPYSKGVDGKPVVDSAQFPLTVVDDVRAIYSSYMDEVRRFRAGGTPDGDTDSKEAVAGERDIQAVPVPG